MGCIVQCSYYTVKHLRELFLQRRLAYRVGLEPTTSGFGDQRSAS